MALFLFAVAWFLLLLRRLFLAFLATLGCWLLLMLGFLLLLLTLLLRRILLLLLLHICGRICNTIAIHLLHVRCGRAAHLLQKMLTY